MRASPVGWAFGSLEEVLAAAERSARVRVVKQRIFRKYCIYYALPLYMSRPFKNIIH